MSLTVVQWGAPAGQGKLLIPQKGVRVALPFTADYITAHVSIHASEPVKIVAYDAAVQPIDGMQSDNNGHEEQLLKLVAPGARLLLISGGDNESTLVELCIYQLPEGYTELPGYRAIAWDLARIPG